MIFSNKQGVEVALDSRLHKRSGTSLDSYKNDSKNGIKKYVLNYLFMSIALLKILGYLLICGIGYRLLKKSTLLEWINMRSSEYAGLYGNTNLTDLQWVIAVAGIIINISGIAMAYRSIKSTLSKIRPANRQDSLKAKIVAILLCVLVACLVIIVFTLSLDGGLKGVSIWDILIVGAIFKAIWVGIVGPTNHSRKAL